MGAGAPSGGERQLACRCSSTECVPGAEMQTQAVQVRGYRRQHHRPFKTLALVRSDAAQAMTCEMMNRRLHSGMSPTHRPERGHRFPRLIRRVAIAFLGQRIERQACVQLQAIGRTVKAMIEAACVERWKGGLTSLDQRYRRSHVAALPLQLRAQHKAVSSARMVAGTPSTTGAFALPLAIQQVCCSNTEYSFFAAGIVSPSRTRGRT